ncbi:MAG: GNAT family N-acetyltransferase [Saccharofermentanales bacterium]|jgi:RimJ/RimL family protein N-acetyltransferase
MLFDFLFTDKEINSPHELERIVWDSMLDNTRAQHVYENKIGAKKTKIVENSWQDQTGTWRTAVYYEITRETFYSLHF